MVSRRAVEPRTVRDLGGAAPYAPATGLDPPEGGRPAAAPTPSRSGDPFRARLDGIRIGTRVIAPQPGQRPGQGARPAERGQATRPQRGPYPQPSRDQARPCLAQGRPDLTGEQL